MQRTTFSTQGRKVSFSFEGNYYLPGTNAKEFFGERLGGARFIVSTTTVIYDKGLRAETRFGCPALIEYDNGYVGYQNFQGFKTIEEAKKDYELRKHLSTKMGIHAYCDIFLIEL